VHSQTRAGRGLPESSVTNRGPRTGSLASAIVTWRPRRAWRRHPKSPCGSAAHVPVVADPKVLHCRGRPSGACARLPKPVGQYETLSLQRGVPTCLTPATVAEGIHTPDFPSNDTQAKNLPFGSNPYGYCVQLGQGCLATPSCMPGTMSQLGILAWNGLAGFALAGDGGRCNGRCQARRVGMAPSKAGPGLPVFVTISSRGGGFLRRGCSVRHWSASRPTPRLALRVQLRSSSRRGRLPFCSGRIGGRV
jgi:hypothetical protein